MTDSGSVYCPKCHSYMDVAVKGVAVPWGMNGDFRIGDLYACRVCGITVVTNFGKPFHPVATVEATPQ